MRVLVSLLALGLGACDGCSNKEAPAVPAPVSRSGRTTGKPHVATQPRRWARPVAPALPASSAAWEAAEAKRTADAWDAAADAYARERASCVDDCLDAQYAVVLARKNAMAAEALTRPGPDESPPLPKRVEALVAALDDYVEMAPATDPDASDMEFLAANAQRAWHQPDAIARLEVFLRVHRNEPAAEYAANMLLDSLVREGRIDELKRWVAELLADASFLIGKDALRATLEKLATS